MELLKNLEGLSADEQMSAVVELQKAAMKHLEEQKQASIGKSAEMVILGLKKIKSDFEAKFDSLNYDIQTKVANLKDGEQGLQGPKGEQGDRGLDGYQGKDGRDGKDGKDGADGVNGVGVQDAKIDFDGSLVITLSDGREINVGEVVPVDVAEKIRTVHNIQSGSGGDSQTVLDAIAALQATIATYGTMATQNANNVAITGGTINNTTIGATTPSTGVFTTLGVTTSINASSAGANADLNVNAKGTGNVVITPQSTNAVGLVIAAPSGSTSNSGRLFFDSTSGVSAIANIGGNQLSFRTAATIGSSSGSVQALVSHTASAVNYHQLTGSATGSGPIHSVAGSDTNIDLNLTTKGTGVVNLNAGAGVSFKAGQTFLSGTPVNYVYSSSRQAGVGPVIGAEGSDGSVPLLVVAKGISGIQFFSASGGAQQMAISHTASAVNYVQVTGAATGSGPTLSVQGSDTNAFLAISSKGTSAIRLQTGGTSQVFINNISGAVNTIALAGSTTGTAVTINAQGSDTNIPLVLQPKGTGALQAQQTDSTATGGNARGANAVDWQTSRSAANQVASGQVSFVGGGFGNKATGYASVVTGGYGNTESNQGFVGGGSSNTQGGIYGAIVGGSQNTLGSNAYSSIIGAGYQNNAQGYFSSVLGGTINSTTSGSAVTTQSSTMNGTTAVTLSGSNASIKVGQLVTGTYIPFPNCYVAAISGTSLTLSVAASGSGTATLSFYTPHGVVVGGGNNQATGSYSFIGGGGDAGTASNRNVASGDWSTVGGGWKNVASGNGAFIGGGGYLSGTAYGNTASGQNAIVVGGIQNTTSGQQSFIGGGYNNTANGVNSVIVGSNNGTTRSIDGFNAFPASNGPIAGSSGVQQSGLLILGRQTTDATATVLTSNSSAASGTNQVILPNNSAYYFKGSVIANVTGGGNTKGWSIEGAIKRGANAASTALVGTPTVTSGYADAGASTWAITATADTTNGGLAITFTGQAGTTIRVVAKLETTEVTF